MQKDSLRMLFFTPGLRKDSVVLWGKMKCQYVSKLEDMRLSQWQLLLSTCKKFRLSDVLTYTQLDSKRDNDVTCWPTIILLGATRLYILGFP